MQIKIVAAFCITAIAAGCAKNRLEENRYWSAQPDNANVKFINAFAGLNPSAASPGTGPSVDVFINNAKISAAPVAYTGLFPAVSGQYASITPGAVALKAVINRSTGALPTDVIVNGSFNMVGGTYYSAFLVDTVPLPAPANANIAIVQDDATRAKPGFFKMRFAHMMPTVDTMEIVSKNNNAVLITDITYKTASAFIELPLYTKNDTIQLRRKGTTVVLTDQKPFFPTSERLYTFYCRGVYTATGGTRPRALSVYTNQ
jgi:Domain of unknown function (DUF4397)